jgi:hypothetical protein
MLEKILQKMKSQRGKTSNVTDRSLQDLAKTYESFITTDEQLETADFSPAIASLDGNINKYTADAVTKEKADRQKAIDEAVAKAKGTTPTTEEKKPEEGQETPEWVQALIDKTKKLEESLNSLQGERTATVRQQQLQEVLKGTPDYFQKPIVTGVTRLQFNTEEEFTEYIETVKQTRTDFEQAAKEQGLNTAAPGTDRKPTGNNGQTDALATARELANKARQKAEEEKK